MLEVFTRKWWLLGIRGVAAIIFAILLFASPALTLGSMIVFFGAFALVDGVFNSIGAIFSINKYDGWWVTLLGGIVSIIAGLITVTWPGLTALSVLWLIAGWAVLSGIVQIVVALRLRKELKGEWLMAAGGALSILFGVVFFLWPSSGVLAITWLVASYALVSGSAMIVLSFRVRSAHKTIVDANTMQAANS